MLLTRARLQVKNSGNRSCQFGLVVDISTNCSLGMSKRRPSCQL